MLKKTIQSITAIVLLVMGKAMLHGDFMPFLQWWLVVFILGIIFMPITSVLFSAFHDKGYLFSKTIGIAVSGYFMWIISSLHILKFTAVSCIITVIISVIVNFLVIIYQKTRNKGNIDARNRISFDLFKEGTLETVIWEELMFFGLFILFVYIRGFKPEAYGTEKFMDYGFMTSMMRSEYMPPQDFWFSGTGLNYYYVGQYMATFLTKLSFVKVSYGYNLMLMMVAAFAFVLPYSLVHNMILRFASSDRKCSKILSILGGVIAGAGVCLAGNMHFPVYKWVEPAIRNFFGIEGSADKYWFPDATRFIGYHPETTDKTIHEFPSYSFVLGDLHAHVINILFVLTVLGILFAWMSTREKAQYAKIPVWKEVLHPSMIMIAFFIGLFHTTNFWDFPIYYVVSGVVILFSNMVVYNFKGKALWLTALQGVFIMLAARLLIHPFTLNFEQISTNICLTVAHSPLNQLIILWGLPICLMIAFLCFLIANFRRKDKDLIKVEKSKNKFVLFRFMDSMKSSDLFILIIGLCAIGLILIPEVIYVEDIYSGDYKRANTMFKLTYQAFLMFGICFGYILIRLLFFGETKRQKRVAAISTLLFVTTLFYVGNAVNAWYGNVFDSKGYKGIDATAFMKTEMYDDYLATNWLNENVTETPVVLEANGDSYTDYERVSVITGLPTVLGWRTHEWLWKSDTTALDERAEDIKVIYTSTNEAEVRSCIDKYQISYIYVGKLEQEKFEGLNHDLIKKLGRVVYRGLNTIEKTYETYIVEVVKK